MMATVSVESNELFLDDFYMDDTEISSLFESVNEIEEMYFNLETTKQYTLFTGGAVGSDLYWQKIGAKFGIRVKALSFEGHGSSKNNARVVLTRKQLDEADRYLHKANKTLKRHFPTNKSFVDNLLRRNWYQVKDTDAVYAVGRLNFSRRTVEGGTGWAVQMAIDSKKTVYVFDIGSCTWQHFDHGKHRFLACELPKLTLNFTGIGTRSLPESGKQEIEKVFEKTFGKPCNR